MAVAWSFYSARRRVSIKQYVERRNLGSYDELVVDLANRGIDAPTEDQYISEVGKKAAPPAPPMKPKAKVTAQKPKPKSKSKPKPKSTRSLSKKTKVRPPVSEADEAWEAVNSDYSDKDKK